MIQDNFGLYHPEQEIKRVIARLEGQLARASSDQLRGALRRAIEQKTALLSTVNPNTDTGLRDSDQSDAMKLRV